MATMYPSSDGYFQPAGQCTMSQSLNHFKLVSWAWQWVHCTKMAPTVTRSQPNRASLGCGGKGAFFVPWMCIPQISTNKMISYQYGPTFLKNAFSTLLNQCHVEFVNAFDNPCLSHCQHSVEPGMFSLSWFWVVFQPERADGAAAEATVITSLLEKHSPALWAPLGFPFLTYQHNTHFIVRLFDRSEVLAFRGATSPSATWLWFYAP